MLSQEASKSNRNEQWWSYDTPYDIVNRRGLVEGGDEEKVQAIDTYISYINNEMSDSYMIATRFDHRNNKELKKVRSKGTRVYKLNQRGYYVPQGYVSMSATFYGDKVILDREDPIVINQEAGFGVTPYEYVKFANKYPSGLQYGVEYRFRENAFASVVMRLMQLEKGDRKYVQAWDSPWNY